MMLKWFQTVMVARPTHPQSALRQHYAFNTARLGSHDCNSARTQTSVQEDSTHAMPSTISLSHGRPSISERMSFRLK